ncbi:hypothetical protein KR222_000710, partial [Zaprionus bogoriensis]
RKRLRRIYLVATVFTSIGLLQMGAIKLVSPRLLHSLPVPSFMWLVIALVCMALLVCSELLNKFPVNWTLSIVAIESITFSVVGYSWNQISYRYASGALIIVFLLNTLMYLLGAFLPLRILPGYRVALGATFVFVIGYVLFSCIVYAADMQNLFLIVDSWCLLYLLLLELYTATLIHHRRIRNMISREYVFSATLITSYFLYMSHIISSIAYKSFESAVHR